MREGDFEGGGVEGGDPRFVGIPDDGDKTSRHLCPRMSRARAHTRTHATGCRRAYFILGVAAVSRCRPFVYNFNQPGDGG